MISGTSKSHIPNFFVFLFLCLLSSCSSCGTAVDTNKNTPHERKMTVSASGNIGLLQYSPQYPPPVMQPDRFYHLLNVKVRPDMTLNTVFYYMVKERSFVAERQFWDSVTKFDYNQVLYYPDSHFAYGTWKGAVHIGDNKRTMENPLVINGKEFKVLTVEGTYDYRDAKPHEHRKDATIYTRCFQVVYHMGSNYIFELVTATDGITFPMGYGSVKPTVDVASLKRFLTGYVRMLKE